MANKRRKYRLAMLDDSTLREVFHIRMNWLGAVSVVTLGIVVLLFILSLLIVYTPLRNIMPGYSASVRQQLIQESARVDSLQTSLTLQRQYLDVIKQVVAGDVKTDTVKRLDSLQLIEKTQILEERSELTDAFLEQYEQKERDRLLLFENASERNVRQLYRPVRGSVVAPARPDLNIYGVSVKTASNENVLAVMRGTLVLVTREEDNSLTIVLQYNQYVTIYRHVTRALKIQGAQVEAGEAIGVMSGEEPLMIEMWDAGKFVNPEEVIVW